MRTLVGIRRPTLVTHAAPPPPVKPPSPGLYLIVSPRGRS